MKYYFIRHSLNKRILGHYPQIKNIIHYYTTEEAPLFIDQFNFGKTNLNLIISNITLHPTSKATDYIDVKGEIGFLFKLLISGKLKSILEKNKTLGIQFFPCTVFKNNIEYTDYWVLNYYGINYQFLDFKNSAFFVTTKFDKTNKLDIDNENNFIEKQKEIAKEGYPKGLLIDKIEIKKNNAEHFFIIQNTEDGIQYIASEKLKKEIEEANCTGIEFQPIELSLREWLHGGEREKIYEK
ncbi:hypothetical protein LPB248_14950 [Flavobacterium sp. LPB0248]|uniref:imm11 family protein n=1 Tax=Flavobacterium sp. LPB0248 TaxID=2614441 RepID=UPI0015A61929|nr:DUF1629 domain-containing protein [Flavobacterium sp. LPB0248]QLC67554.1 hypothetical protein LPB248_14950 [Flavobacterium sp. LPB0248]